MVREWVECWFRAACVTAVWSTIKRIWFFQLLTCWQKLLFVPEKQFTAEAIQSQKLIVKCFFFSSFIPLCNKDRYHILTFLSENFRLKWREGLCSLFKLLYEVFLSLLSLRIEQQTILQLLACSCVSFEWKWGWWWPCFDRNLPAFLMLMILLSC